MDYKKFNWWGVIIASFLLAGWFVWQVLFPTFHYYSGKVGLNKASDSLVYLFSSGQDNFIVSTPVFNYNFGKIKLKLKSKELKNIQDKLPVYKNYPAAVYPLGKDIKSVSELNNLIKNKNLPNFPAGSLAVKKDKVYLITQGKYYPIVTGEVFNQLGFKWSNLKKIKSDQLAYLEKGSLLGYNQPHPAGIIFETASGALYLVTSDKKIRLIVSRKLLEKVWPEYHTIKIKKIGDNFIGKCEKQFNLLNNFSCQVKTKNKAEITPGAYLFKISSNIPEKDIQLKVSFSVGNNFNWAIAKDSLKIIKDRFNEKVGNKYN